VLWKLSDITDWWWGGGGGGAAPSSAHLSWLGHTNGGCGGGWVISRLLTFLLLGERWNSNKKDNGKTVFSERTFLAA
jgi:hypothetical protein